MRTRCLPDPRSPPRERSESWGSNPHAIPAAKYLPSAVRGLQNPTLELACAGQGEFVRNPPCAGANRATTMGLPSKGHAPLPGVSTFCKRLRQFRAFARHAVLSSRGPHLPRRMRRADRHRRRSGRRQRALTASQRQRARGRTARAARPVRLRRSRRRTQSRRRR